MGYDPPIVEGPSDGDGGDPGFLRMVTVDLTAEQIAFLESGEVEVVEAQGPGTWIVPVAATFQYTPGVSPFANGGGQLALGSSSAHLTSANAAFNELNSWVRPFEPNAFANSQTSVENLPLELYAATDPEYAGSILTSDVEDAGTGYEIGDEITLVVNDDGTAAVLTVDTVGDDGEVLTYHITNPGDGYGTEPTAQDTTSGVGEGFSLSVDTITPTSDGTGRLTVVYYVMSLT